MKGCQAKKPDGKGCGSSPLKGSRFCLFHDPSPETKAKLLQARRQGGSVRQNPEKVVPLEGPGSVIDIARRAIKGVRIRAADPEGKKGMDAGSGKAIAALCQVILAALKLDSTDKKVDELEKRLAALGDMSEEKLLRIAEGGDATSSSSEGH